MIEKDIEDYLTRRVLEAGGEVRKVAWLGRKHAPDRRVMHPRLRCWVELKRPDAKPRPGQLREHERMRRMGEDVRVIDSFEGVDELIAGVVG